MFYEIHLYILLYPTDFYRWYLCNASEVWNSGLININMVLPVRSMKLHHFYGWDGDFTLELYWLSTELLIKKLTPSDWMELCHLLRQRRKIKVFTIKDGSTDDSLLAFAVTAPPSPTAGLARPQLQRGSATNIIFILSLIVMPEISPHPQCQNQIKQTTGKESLTILLPGLMIFFI